MKRSSRAKRPTVASRARSARASKGPRSRARSRRPTLSFLEKEPPKFVGRDGSPVLDHYPPKDPSLTLRTPTPVSAAAASARSTAGLSATPGAPAPVAPAAPPGEPPKGLISLERPFDVDEFAQLLGETAIQVTVPREELPEVLRRVTDFMGFGIYVYSIQIRPASEELLKKYVVVLQRVDFSAERTEWIPFEEKGRSESPFGPEGRR